MSCRRATLNDQAKKLSQQTKRGIPAELTRVAADLDNSCGEDDFRKAWISIEWMNGCLNNFTKDVELGYVREMKVTLAHSVLNQTLVRSDINASFWVSFA